MITQSYPINLSYGLALEKEQKLFSERCGYCLNDFRKEDKVAILKCRHVFHKACLTEAPQKICPFDKGPFHYFKATFLDYSLTCTGPTLEYLTRVNLVSQQQILQIQDHFQQFAKKSAPEYEGMKPALEAFFKVAQDSIDYLEGRLPLEASWKELFEKRFLEVAPFLDFIADECKKHIISNWNSGQMHMFPEAWKLRRAIGLASLTTRDEEYAAFLLKFYGIFSSLLTTIEILPQYREVIRTEKKRMQWKFYMRHFKALRPLSSFRRFTYLWKLSPSVLEKMRNLTTGNSPTSKDIRGTIQKIESLRKNLGNRLAEIIIFSANAFFIDELASNLCTTFTLSGMCWYEYRWLKKGSPISKELAELFAEHFEKLKKLSFLKQMQYLNHMDVGHLRCLYWVKKDNANPYQKMIAITLAIKNRVIPCILLSIPTRYLFSKG